MWNRDARWSKRLQVEQAIMGSRFPQFVLRQRSDDTLYWEGYLEPIEDEFFRVTLSYPTRFPYVQPVLRVVEPELPHHCPHRYRDGSICVYRNAWDPNRSTCASVVPLLAAWLVAYVAWRDTGRSF